MGKQKEFLNRELANLKKRYQEARDMINTEWTIKQEVKCSTCGYLNKDHLKSYKTLICPSYEIVLFKRAGRIQEDNISYHSGMPNLVDIVEVLRGLDKEEDNKNEVKIS